MAVYWSPGNGPYLPPQADPASNRRGGVAASPPTALLRPGYPPVSMPTNPGIRYGVPGATPYYVRQPQADPRNPRQSLRQPYPAFMNQDGVQMLGSSNPLLVHPAALSSIAAAAPEAAHQLKRPRIDSRGTGAPTAPLTIDTKETTGYQPQVEAISPTPEDRPAERDDIKSTKDDLLQKISKVDREIAKAESQIAKLKKKQEELEDAAKKPSTDSGNDEEKPNQSIAQNVYSENRRKASQSHANLNQFSPGNLLPLYNQPSDTEVYNNNKKEYTVFKKKLVEYFKKKNEENETRDRYMTVTYCKLTSEWTRKVNRSESSKKRKEREGKSREMYEKMFPELRKQREDKDRNERLGTRGTVRSDQEFQDVIDRIQEHELEEKKMHSYAVIPPPLLPPEDRRRKFTNNNGLVQDPLHVYNERKFVNMWTDAEKETFREKYLQHPKNFYMIAQYLERKCVSDCVQYYYLSKKTENYKQLLRKSRPRGGARRRPNNPTGEVIAPNLPGVVTRRTVQGLQAEKEGEGNKVASRSSTPQPPIKIEKESNEDSEKEGKGRKDRNPRDKKVDNESSDEEDSNQPVKCGPHPCIVCKSTVESSRAVPKERAGQLGLKEEDLDDNSRVCNTCWCKTLRSKCPLLSCSTSSKGKKLRHLPLKWKDLAPPTKDALINELQIPEGTKQVCTTCFGRINKRIGQLEDGDKKVEKEEVPWADAEIELLRLGLRSHGNNWEKISTTLPEKTPEQCKKYFYSMRKKLQLDKIVHEYKKANRPSGSEKPSLSSDEESGSSTSSCEDENNDNNTDKNKDLKAPEVPVSTAGPAPKSEQAEEGRKEEGAPRKEEAGYDSAATVSADETHEMDRRTLAGPKPFPTIPTSLQMSKAISVQDIMNNVIDKSLIRPFNQTPRTSEIQTIKDLLPDPASIPSHHSFMKGSLGLPPPDLEVRAISAAQSVAGRGPAAVEDGVLNLTTTKRARSPPSHPPPHPAEHVYRSQYIEQHHRGAPLGNPNPVPLGEKPPEAHGSSKLKTTHKESMNADNLLLKSYEKNNSIHTPNHMIPRSDPRHKIVSLPKSYPPPPQGSITRGQPIPQPQHPVGGRYDPNQLKAMQAQRGPGSLTSGTPVYTTDRRNAQVYAEPPRSSASGLDIHKKQSPFPAYPRPTGHEMRGSSSRSVLENDYIVAQSLPRKDQSEDFRAGQFRGIDHRGREVQIVDQRFDPRPPFYGAPPRGPNPYSNIRTDPKADMPPKDSGRGDPMVDMHDPRMAMDPRGRPTYPGYPTNMRDPGRRSPPRSAPTSRPQTSQAPAPRPGSITSGLPRSSVEIHTIPRQPEVSITKQPANPTSRPEYANQLSNFAEIALQQPKMRETDHRGNPSLTVTRTDMGVGSNRMQADLAKSVYDRNVRPTDDRSREMSRMQREQEVLMQKLNMMSEQERQKYYEEAKMATSQMGYKMPSLTTKNIIDLIVTNTIGKAMVGGSTAGALAAASAAYALKGRSDGPTTTAQSSMSMIPQVSPNKPGSSRSPSIKASDVEDRNNMMARTSPAVATSLGEHLDNMIKKEVQKNRTSPFPGLPPQSQAEAVEYWKRKQYPNDPNFMPRPPSQGSLPRPPSGGVAQLGSDERQIIRVAQNASPHPEKPPSRPMMESISPTNSDPARSTPNYAYQGADPMARFLAAAHRKPHEVDAAKSSGAILNYFNTQIAEAMKNDKTAEQPGKSGPTTNSVSMGPPNKRPLENDARGSPVGEPSGSTESPRKRYKHDDQGGPSDLPDSPGSGEMVIDESARPDSAHSHKTASPAPHADPALYPGYRQALPPRSSPGQPPRPPPQTNNPSRYEPLSDED